MKNLSKISNGVKVQSLNLSLSIFRPPTLIRPFNLKSFWILSIISIIALFSFYIFQINSIVSESYQIQNYQKRIKVINQNNEALEINLTQVNSLENIEKQIEELGFEKAGQIHYIRVLESQIVTKPRLQR
ncbi:MAG: hypothetical protein QME61_01165 [Patescibacteria group bacterium]|nr:hypothetical protein [Patescibacteria group bacterium]